MKVVIVSDIHDNLPNLAKCLAWCQQNEIEAMICCGDVTNCETLQYLAVKFVGKIFLVRGNMEIYGETEVDQYKNIKYLGRYSLAEIDNKKVGICHEPLFINNILKLCEPNRDCDIIFYGHTHQPWEEKRDDVRILNPGTVAGTFSKPTFAAWDTETGNVELKLLELV